jgi:hypothetical protein
MTVAGGLGLDTSGYSIPYLTSWSDTDDGLDVIETCAGLIDRIAKRIEDAIGERSSLDFLGPRNDASSNQPECRIAV